MFVENKKEPGPCLTFQAPQPPTNLSRKNGIGYSLAGHLWLGNCLPFFPSFYIGRKVSLRDFSL
jgi:hypothetical protein